MALSKLALKVFLISLMSGVVCSANSASNNGQFFSSHSAITEQTDCFAPPYDDASNLRTIIADFTQMESRAINHVFSEQLFDMRKNRYECLRFTYQVDGTEVPGFMFRSVNAGSDSPVLVYHRGGNGKYGQIRWVNLYLKYLDMAANGYTIIGSNLRENDEFGGADVDDTRELLNIVHGMENVDHNRIALWGVSRGASQMMQVARNRNDIRALVFEAGNADHQRALQDRPEMIDVYLKRVPNFEDNREEELAKRSVIFWADELPDVPVLILHGDADDRVDVEQAHLLARALDESGHEYELKVYSGAGHALPDNAREDMFRWLNTVLNN
ncbi:Prolyl oligopeptidase family protein [Pseudidiomarina indica]|uniref:Prolyl oligopeptidase family protein n=1 Tax=Pseudidiomarina indica TaxID=1159017 RepID=A0A1G6DYP0_9GAMM|nr:prolyl oligopeptidase family serine peptidase [Pseudidiomarina indica]SDB50232.1 Prolyl oligopeptidase family protein [Pseudidiomarina indica]